MKNYAFIDSQNLNLAIKDCGWILDFKKLRIHLKDKYRVEKAFIFIGYKTGNEFLYSKLQNEGYCLIFKPTLETKEGITKGNCDAELVLHTMIELENFDKAIIISGDGDFHCLIEHLKEESKLLNVGIPNKYRYSALLKKFGKYMFFIDRLQHKLEKKKEA